MLFWNVNCLFIFKDTPRNNRSHEDGGVAPVVPWNNLLKKEGILEFV